MQGRNTPGAVPTTTAEEALRFRMLRTAYLAALLGFVGACEYAGGVPYCHERDDPCRCDSLGPTDIVVNSLADFAPLMELESIEGGLFVCSVPGPVLLTLPHLTWATAIVIQGNGIETLDFLPSLRGVNHLVIFSNPALLDVDLPSLEGSFELEIRGNPRLKSARMPSLTWAGSLLVTGAALSELASPTLAAIDYTLTIEDSALSALEMPQLAQVGEIVVAFNPLLTTAAFVSLHALDSLQIKRNRVLTRLELPNIASATPAIDVIGNDSLTDLADLGAISGTGNLTISVNARLSSVTGLASLTTVGGNLVISDNPALPTCNAERLLAQIQAAGGVAGTITIRGNDDTGTCQ